MFTIRKRVSQSIIKLNIKLFPDFFNLSVYAKISPKSIYQNKTIYKKYV